MSTEINFYNWAISHRLFAIHRKACSLSSISQLRLADYSSCKHMHWICLEMFHMDLLDSISVSNVFFVRPLMTFQLLYNPLCPTLSALLLERFHGAAFLGLCSSNLWFVATCYLSSCFVICCSNSQFIIVVSYMLCFYLFFCYFHLCSKSRTEVLLGKSMT